LSLNAASFRRYRETSGLLYYVYIIMKALNGFLMTQRQMSLTDVCGYIQCYKTSSATYVGRFLSWYCWNDLSISAILRYSVHRTIS